MSTVISWRYDVLRIQSLFGLLARLQLRRVVEWVNLAGSVIETWLKSRLMGYISAERHPGHALECSLIHNRARSHAGIAKVAATSNGRLRTSFEVHCSYFITQMRLKAVVSQVVMPSAA